MNDDIWTKYFGDVNYCSAKAFLNMTAETKDDGNTISYKIEIPGYGSDDVKVYTEDGSVCIEVGGKSYYVEIPDYYKAGPECTVKHGILTINLHKICTKRVIRVVG